MRKKALLAIILSSVFVISLQYLNSSPYSIWIINKTTSLAQEQCPVNWNFDDLKNTPSLSLQTDGDYDQLNSILLNSDHVNMQQAAITGALIGGGTAPNGLIFSSSGFINFESVEINHSGANRYKIDHLGHLEFNNSRTNVLNLTAAGLTHSESFPLVITGDEKLDTVYLDNCLNWSWPKSIPSNEMLPDRWQFKATDSHGNTRQLEIQKLLNIKTISRDKIKQWANHSEILNSQITNTNKQHINNKEYGDHPETIENNLETKVLAWGKNNAGQFGNGIKVTQPLTPQWSSEIEKILKPDYEIIEIDGGSYSSCLLRSDKTVWCWGGGNTHNPRTMPPKIHKVEALPSIKSLNIGSSYTFCAKSENDENWCWDHRDTKAQKATIPNWDKTKFTTDEYQKLWSSFKDNYNGITDSCAITDQGKIWCWGEKHSQGKPIDAPSQKSKSMFPMEVILDKPAISVNVGKFQSCAILEDYSSWCWSNNLEPSPIKLFSKGIKTKQVFSGWGQGCALQENKTVWCWKALGYGPNYKVTTEQIKISDEQALTDVTKLDNQGNALFCALKNDGSAWCWGGLGGDPSQPSSKSIRQIKGPSGICNISEVGDITTGAWTGYAVIKSTANDIEKLSHPDNSLEILSAIQAGDFSKARNHIEKSPCFSAKSVLAETALRTAIEKQQLDLVTQLIDAGANIELSHDKHNTALLIAANQDSWTTRTQTSTEILRILVEAGADLHATDIYKNTPLMILEPNTETYNIVLDGLQKQLGRNLYTHPPHSLRLKDLKIDNQDCTPGKVTFSRSGKYKVDIPSNCQSALAKVWGAGGGGYNGGTGGFSLGILDLENTADVYAIVGGAGQSGKRGERGTGGFNGGGFGGEGGLRTNYAWGSGGGGGGRSEISINGASIIIAGGGGGVGRETISLPGGGYDAKSYMTDYLKYVTTGFSSGSRANKGQLGDNGKGGDAGARSSISPGCLPATDGENFYGGDGSRVLNGESCGASGGGGGGGGYGGGGGGGHDSGGAGGGGGGLAPQYGITFWGGLTKTANTDDPDYKHPNGNAEKDGLIVISWPAPSPNQLMTKINSIVPHQLEQQKSRLKTLDAIDNTLSDTNTRAVNKSFKEIPNLFKNHIRPKQTLKKYTSQTERHFVKYSDENHVINDVWLNKQQEEALKKAIKRQRASVLQYDDDFDGIVTQTEVQNIANKNYRNIDSGEQNNKKIENMINRVMAFDANKDGSITRQEMIILDDKMQQSAKRHVSNSYDGFFDIDEDKDRIITLEDFKNAAQSAFYIIDTNKDDKISQEEYNSWHSNTSKQSNKQATEIISTASIVQYPASLSTSLLRMKIQGVSENKINFDPPEKIGDVLAPQNYVFHPSGGGATYKSPEEKLIVNDNVSWIFSSGWKVTRIDNNKGNTEHNEIIAFLPYINKDACIQINNALGIKSGIDADKDGVPKGSKLNTIPSIQHNMTETNPGISPLIDEIDQRPFIGSPFGCYDSSDENNISGDGPYVYYHVLIER